MAHNILIPLFPTFMFIEAFRSGSEPTAYGEKHSPDLNQVVRTFNPQHFTPPIVNNHDESLPNKGTVGKLCVLGDSLFFEPETLAEDFRQQVNDREFPALSAAFYHPTDNRNPYPGQWSLRHISTVQIPAKKGLQRPYFSKSYPEPFEFQLEDPNIIIGYAEHPFYFDMVNSFQQSASPAVSPNLAEPVQPPAVSPNLAEPLQPPAVSPNLAEPLQPIQYAESVAASNDLRRRELAVQQREIALELRELDLQMQTFVAYAESRPAVKQLDRPLLEAIARLLLSQSEVVYAEKSCKPIDLFRQLLDSLTPPDVVFGEAAPAANPPAPRIDLTDASQKIAAYAEQHGVGLVEATQHVWSTL